MAHAAALSVRGVLGKPALGGALLALLFWFQSLTPSLIPRSWVMQTVVGAVSLAIGYGIGAWAGGMSGRRGDIVLAVAWLVAVVLGAKLWLGWQGEQRSLMGMAPLGWLDGVLVGVLSPLAGVLLVVVGRVVVRGVAAVKRTTALVLLVIVAAGFAIFVAVAGANRARANDETNVGTVVPTSPSVSGSPASLVPWDTLGRWGRDFVATATSPQELAQFHGAGARTVAPVRVYVGVRSADSMAQRAQLAVRELERAGGFDRKVLVVWVPTGTGWIVPKAAASLEQVYRGDTAIIAVQYSYLPSLLAIFLAPGRAEETGITLFEAVHAHWATLPSDRRPKLILFGKSLGAEGVEAPFVAADASSSVGNMVARTDGVLIAGAKKGNPILSQLTRDRDHGSPFWQPVFRGGRSVRFLNQDPHQRALDTEWKAPRIAYLQNPADPAICWSFQALWWPPECMARPRGFDMPDAMRWFPVVSGVQAVGDVLKQLDVPSGFGHNYSSEYAEGWASVLPPEGWTPADNERLVRFIARIPGDESEP